MSSTDSNTEMPGTQTTASKEPSDTSNSSSSTGGSWLDRVFGSKFTEFSDRQRLYRLEQCRDIERVLRDCQQKRRKKQPHDEFAMEEGVSGIRMARYFGWRSTDPIADLQERHTEPPIEEKAAAASNIPTCAKETHATWGCRAVALACAADLVVLKRCFEKYDQSQILSQPHTDYEGKMEENVTTASAIPCQQEQRILGACVMRNASRLEERLRQQKKL